MKLIKSKIGAIFVAIYVIFVAITIVIALNDDEFWRRLYLLLTIIPWSLLSSEFVKLIDKDIWLIAPFFWILNILIIYFIGYFFTWLLKKIKYRSSGSDK